MRFAQTGYWSGTLTVDGETFDVTADRWWGTRDRSWGVRPVGEQEHPGIRGAEGQMTGMWNYSPMQFPDCSILYMLNETNKGERMIEEAVRIWNDPARAPEHLGRPEYEHELTPGTRMIERSVLHFPDAPGGALQREGDADAHRLHRRRHRLRDGAGLASRHVPGRAGRSGAYEGRRRDRGHRPVRYRRPRRAVRRERRHVSATACTSTGFGVRSTSTE